LQIEKLDMLSCKKTIRIQRGLLTTYKFLHHLTQAVLPVVIYDHRLIPQLSAYEYQSLIVLGKDEALKDNQLGAQKGVQVLKITMTGRRAVRRHLKMSRHLDRKFG
jgi:hypothetical protein